MGAQWPSGLERRTSDLVVLGSNSAGGTLLRNFGNSVYPALPVSFGGATKHRRSLFLVCMLTISYLLTYLFTYPLLSSLGYQSC